MALMVGPFLILFACFLWATDMLVRNALMASGPNALSIVFLEHCVLAFFSIFIVWKRKEKFWNSQISHVFYFFVVGFMGSALALWAFTEAFQYLNPGIVVILQKLQPLWAIFLARIVLNEPLAKHFYHWAAVCLLGALLVSAQDFALFWQELFHGRLYASQLIKGHALALIAVVGWASATVYGKRLMNEGFDEKEIMSGRFIFGFIGMSALVLWQRPEIQLFNAVSWSKIILLILLSGIFGMYFYYKGLRKISARLCALLELSFPFFAVTASWLYLDQPLAPIQIIGGFLILLGGTIIQIKHY
jgi:drug/metabolite transporter (DMT)-like permease